MTTKKRPVLNPNIAAVVKPKRCVTPASADVVARTANKSNATTPIGMKFDSRGVMNDRRRLTLKYNSKESTELLKLEIPKLVL
jgi:hypothetical protein